MIDLLEDALAERALTDRPALGTVEERLEIIVERLKYVRYRFPVQTNGTG